MSYFVEVFFMSNSEKDFVILSDIVPDIIQEIRYYSTYNFIGDRIDGYEEPCALITRAAANALRDASDDFMRQGYCIKVFDTYRPKRAVDHFVRWAEDETDLRMKKIFYPDVQKCDLFTIGYIAKKSGHSRGSTIDMTLLDMSTGREVNMGSPFDYFGKRSQTKFLSHLTGEEVRNRFFLRETMVAHGFKPLEEEWWHFTLADEPYPDTYFDFPVNSREVKR